MILARLRRSRILCAVLLIASPAALGTVLPVIHPCPVDSPWLVAHSAGSGHAGHHGGDQPTPVSGKHGETCHCIGSCRLAATTAVPPSHDITVHVALVPTARPWPSLDSSLVLAPTAALLPPATAPPTA